MGSAMALINCPECGKPVSDRALSCPSCAYPTGQVDSAEAEGKEREKWRGLQRIFAVYWILGVALLLLSIPLMSIGAFALSAMSPMAMLVAVPGQTVVYGTAGVLFVVGGVGFLMARVGAWWHRG